ncbi:MAG TPA: tetratricopeptide repeat protein [Flavobacteriales bacterium]|nr:tetratricopeptide repeat protein [Flavobacteriales bacterium]
MSRPIYIAVFILGFLNHALAAGSKADSLERALKKTRHDTTRINLLNDLCLEYEFEDRGKAIEYVKKAISLARKSTYIKGLCKAFLYRGYLEEDIGNYDSALVYYHRSLKKALELNNKRSIAAAYNSLGQAYQSEGNILQALDYFEKALALDKQLNDQRGIAMQLINIGSIYKAQGNFTKASQHYFKALEIDEKRNNETDVAMDLGNIGILYLDKGDYRRALQYNIKALKLDTRLGNKQGIMRHTNNVANSYFFLENYTKALQMHLKNIEMRINAGDLVGLAHSYGNIGMVYERMGDSAAKKGNNDYALNNMFIKARDYYLKASAIYQASKDLHNEVIQVGHMASLEMKYGNFKKAEQYVLTGLSITDSLGAKNLRMQFEQEASTLYEQMGDYKKSVEHYQNFLNLRDSLFNAEKDKEITRNEMNYNFEKKKDAIKARQAQQAEMDKAKRQRQLIVILITAALALVSITVAVLVMRSLRITKKQKHIIEKQKLEVETKQKEILDSIHYARRIQRALLPGEKHMRSKLQSMGKQ